MKKLDWINNRNDELWIKSGVNELEDAEYPEYDMDGIRFHPEYTDEEWNRYEDMQSSSSRRLHYFTERYEWQNQCEAYGGF